MQGEVSAPQSATYDVFISYRSGHRAWVEWLAQALITCKKSVFLDIWNGIPGQPLIFELDRGLKQCRSAILVATPDVPASSWVQNEYHVLQQRRMDDPDFKLVPITFGNAPDLPFLKGILYVDFSDSSRYQEWLHRTLCGLEGREPGATIALPCKVERPPIPPPVAPSEPSRSTAAVPPTSTSPANEHDVLVGSIVTLLSRIAVPETTYRRHFVRTVNDLAQPGLAAAKGLPGMVRELASLDFDTQPGDVPYGLLQFLCRLRREPGFHDPVNTWIHTHVTQQASVLASLENQLDEEHQQKLLIVDVNNDDTGRIESYDLFVRTRSLAPASGTTSLHRDVKDWEDFVAHLLRDIDDLRAGGIIEDFEIQFLVNPPLFDYKFHAITLSAGDSLGNQRIVLLRHKDRVHSKLRVIRDAWHRHAEALRCCQPAQLQLIPISIGAVGPAREGLFYCDFIVPPRTGDSNPGRVEKETLHRALLTGVSYLYWLHSLPNAQSVGSIPTRLTEWLSTTANVDEFPLRFTQQRLRDPLALEGTLLWDDPLFNPF